jgi:hypothetical protein
MIEIRQGLPRCAGPAHCLCVDTPRADARPLAKCRPGSIFLLPVLAVFRGRASADTAHTRPRRMLHRKTLRGSKDYTARVSGHSKPDACECGGRAHLRTGHRHQVTECCSHNTQDTGRGIPVGMRWFTPLPRGYQYTLTTLPKDTACKGRALVLFTKLGPPHHKHTDGAQRLVCACPFLRAG